MRELHWYCPFCGDSEPVAPTGDGNEYSVWDIEPCECGGTVYVLTLKMAACTSQGHALGLSPRDAIARTMDLVSVAVTVNDGVCHCDEYNKARGHSESCPYAIPRI